jgi:hypothetical protein
VSGQAFDALGPEERAELVRKLERERYGRPVRTDRPYPLVLRRPLGELDEHRHAS